MFTAPQVDIGTSRCAPLEQLRTDRWPIRGGVDDGRVAKDDDLAFAEHMLSHGHAVDEHAAGNARVGDRPAHVLAGETRMKPDHAHAVEDEIVRRVAAQRQRVAVEDQGLVGSGTIGDEEIAHQLRAKSARARCHPLGGDGGADGVEGSIGVEQAIVVLRRLEVHGGRDKDGEAARVSYLTKLHDAEPIPTDLDERAVVEPLVALDAVAIHEGAVG